MIKIGITGGIGSGKSLVCKVFSTFNIPVYYADDEAHGITDNDPEIRREIIALLGDEVYNGQFLNRLLLAEKIFNNKKLLEKVNKIIHPRVSSHFTDWCLKNVHAPYVIQESAILFESNEHRDFDKIVTVVAPVELRIQRVITRKNTTREKIVAIMNNQLPEEVKIKQSHYVINNDETQLIIPQVIQLHQIFIALTNKIS